MHPRLGRYEHTHSQRWAARVNADAFVLVTPEHNFGAPPWLLNALDHLSAEWACKPVGFVSCSGMSAATRAVQMAKRVVTTLKVMPITEGVATPMFTQHLEGDVFRAPEAADRSAGATLPSWRVGPVRRARRAGRHRYAPTLSRLCKRAESVLRYLNTRSIPFPFSR